MENIKNRNYGIDLLRLVSMFLVCLRHTLSQGSAIAVSSGTSNAIYTFLFILTCPAVDCFAIISGYFATNSKPKYEKIIKMWLQVLFYSFGISLAINILRIIFSSPEGFEVSEVVSGLFPLLTHKYWYFSAYFVLFFFMPFLNKAFCDLNKEESKKFLFVLFLLMIVMYAFRGAANHDFLSEGRSAFWLILMYILGILINKTELLKNVNKYILLIIFVVLSIVSFIFQYYLKLNLSANVFPLYWLSAIVLVALFGKTNPNKKIVSFLSPLSFGVFLLHQHYYFRYYFLSERFINYAEINSVKGIVLVVATSVFIFVCGLIIDYIRTVIFKYLNIDKISKKLLSFVDKIVSSII